MVTWRDFSIDSVQTAMFTPDRAQFSAGKVVASILRKFGERFDGEMVALPEATFAKLPPEIPRVTLQSVDGTQRLTVGPGRLDCTWSPTAEASRPSLDSGAEPCVEVLTHYVEDNRVAVGRLAFIVTRTAPVANPAQTLIERFCKEECQTEPFNDSATFEIHNHKEYDPRPGFRINSWVRCQCGQVGPEKNPVILVLQDLNTLANDSPADPYDAPRIRAFFQVAVAEADEIFRKYFPG